MKPFILNSKVKGFIGNSVYNWKRIEFLARVKVEGRRWGESGNVNRAVLWSGGWIRLGMEKPRDMGND